MAIPDNGTLLGVPSEKERGHIPLLWQWISLFGIVLMLYGSILILRLVIVHFIGDELISANEMKLIFAEMGIKGITWVGLPFLYMRFLGKRGAEIIRFFQMDRWEWRKTALIAGGILGAFLFSVVVHWLQGRSYHPVSLQDWINGILLVGIVEEIPFRGLLFQQLRRWMPMWAAATLSSLLFVGVHIPSWMYQQMQMKDMIFNGLFLFAVGISMCIILVKLRSLWSCIAIHSLLDLFLS